MEKNISPEKIEDYCLGLVSDVEAAEITLAASHDPELQKQIAETEQLLIAYAKKDNPVYLRPELKESILNSFLPVPGQNGIDLANPPVIDRNSDAADWKEAVAGLEPDRDHGHIKTFFISFNPDIQLCVAWLYDKLEEEEHQPDDFEESFLILEGACECSIGGKTYRLKAGDYLEIPFNEHHTIKPTSPQGYVKALIQRRKTAA